MALEFCHVNVYIFYLHEDMCSDISKYILNKEKDNNKVNLFGGPHYMTYFGHLDN